MRKICFNESPESRKVVDDKVYDIFALMTAKKLLLSTNDRRPYYGCVLETPLLSMCK